MPTEGEEKAAEAAKEKAFGEMVREGNHLSDLTKASILLGQVASALKLANEQLADAFNRAYEALNGQIRTEGNKLRGKEKAYNEVANFTNVTLEGARNLIQPLIDKEKEEAVEHIRKGLELLQRAVAAGAGVIPEDFPHAFKEFEEAQKILQEVEGKKEILKKFY